MWWKLCRHEFRIQRRDPALWAVAALTAVLVFYAVSSGIAWFQEHRATLEELASSGERELEELTRGLDGDPGETAEGRRDPTDAYQVGRVQQMLVLEPRPLAALAIGQAELYPPAIRVWLLGSPREGADQGSFKSPLALQAGRFDFAFFLIFLLPLLLIAATYDFLSREREQGTMTMALAQPVEPRTWLLIKLGLRGSWVVGPTLGVSWLVWRVGLGEATQAASLLELALWVLTLLLWSGFWLFASAVVASSGRSSATNALLLVGVWLGLVVIAPQVVNLGASVLHPPPSRAGFINELRGATQDMRRDGVDMLARYYEDHPELVPEGQLGEEPEFSFPKALVLLFNDIDRAAEPVERRFEEQLENQQRFVRRLAFSTPVLPLQSALDDLAGTGVARYQQFQAEARRYQAAWKAFFTPRVLGEKPMTREDYRELPRYEPTGETRSQLAARVARSLLVLGIATLALGVWGLVRLGHPPRWISAQPVFDRQPPIPEMPR